jgi:hypothetical protein
LAKIAASSRLGLFGILIQADGANPSIQRIGDIAFFRSLKIAEREALEIMFLEPGGTRPPPSHVFVWLEIPGLEAFPHWGWRPAEPDLDLWWRARITAGNAALPGCE